MSLEGLEDLILVRDIDYKRHKSMQTETLATAKNHKESELMKSHDRLCPEGMRNIEQIYIQESFRHEHF